MDILFLSPVPYLHARSGGSLSSTNDLCLELRALGHAPTVLAAIRGRRNRISKALQRTVAGRLRRDASLGYPVVYSSDPRQALGRVLRVTKPDVVVINASRSGGLVADLQALDLPTVIYHRDVNFALHETPVPSAHTAHVANSTFVAQHVRDRLGVEPVVIPPLVRRSTYETSPVGNEVLFVNPVPKKGRDIAFAVAAACPTLQFRFVEGWPLGQRGFEELEARARLLDNVSVHRRQTDMRPVYRQARVLLVPSQWEEAWGRVVTEAQLSGLPVVASARGGLPQSVGDGGVLVPYDADPSVWAAELTRLFDDTEHYAQLSQRARARAHHPELSAEELIGDFCTVLQRAIDGDGHVS